MERILNQLFFTENTKIVKIKTTSQEDGLASWLPDDFDYYLSFSNNTRFFENQEKIKIEVVEPTKAFGKNKDDQNTFILEFIEHFDELMNHHYPNIPNESEMEIIQKKMDDFRHTHFKFKPQKKKKNEDFLEDTFKQEFLGTWLNPERSFNFTLNPNKGLEENLYIAYSQVKKSRIIPKSIFLHPKRVSELKNEMSKKTPYPTFNPYLTLFDIKIEPEAYLNENSIVIIGTSI